MMLLTNHIERVRAQPEHVRRQVALGIAAILTALIAFLWFGASVATGAFAIKATSFAEATGGVAKPVAQTSAPAPSSLLGAVGAFIGGGQDESPRIEVVSDASKQTTNAKTPVAEPTILPF